MTTKESGASVSVPAQSLHLAVIVARTLAGSCRIVIAGAARAVRKRPVGMPVPAVRIDDYINGYRRSGMPFFRISDRNPSQRGLRTAFAGIVRQFRQGSIARLLPQAGEGQTEYAAKDREL